MTRDDRRLYRELVHAHRARWQAAQPGELLQRMKAQTREVTPATAPSQPPLCQQCKQRKPRHGALCHECTRIADDSALEALGYDIVDWRYVVDLEGHRVLRSIALARIAGRAA